VPLGLDLVGEFSRKKNQGFDAAAAIRNKAQAKLSLRTLSF
jgi:hypothetical protein